MLKSKKFYLIGAIALAIILVIAIFAIAKPSTDVQEEVPVATEETIVEPTTAEDRFFNRNDNSRNKMERIYEIGKRASAGYHNICVDSISKESSIGKDIITCKFTLEKRSNVSDSEVFDEMFKLYVDGNLVEMDKEESSLEDGIIVCSVEKDWNKFEVHFKSSERTRRVIIYEFENSEE